MGFHLLAQHLGVLCGRQGHERRAKTCREGRLRLGDPNLGSRYFGGVAGQEMVHRLACIQPADGRQHSERIARQKEYVLWVGRSSLK